MRRQPFRMLLFILVLAAVPAAWAGAVIEQEGRDPETGEVVRILTYVEPGRLRMEVQGARESTVMIFRADRQLIWIIHPKEKNYQEMTRADVERLAGQLAGLQQQYEAMLKSLPPDQRVAAEQMLKQRAGPGKPVEVTVKRVGSESVGSFSATKYELLTNGERSAEVWAAPLAQLQLQQPEYDTFLQFGRFFEKLSQTAAQMGSAEVLARHAETIEGFPVRVVSYDEGEPAGDVRVLRAERQSVGEDKFQLPSGFRKVELAGPEP